jgi:hypothetical protein
VTALPPETRRALGREALRDALPAIVADLAAPGASGAPDADSRGGPRWVTLHDDQDLARFVAEVVRLADDPSEGPRLRSGELRFRLAPHAAMPAAAAAAPAAGPVARTERRVERGPVTERHVREAEAAGVRRLVLGPGAVLTPMGRDRARGAGVEIVRENVRENGRRT